ncbi:hypothetical protein ACFLRC_04195 [Candidatus Altiarchaeota archaeon]
MPKEKPPKGKPRPLNIDDEDTRRQVELGQMPGLKRADPGEGPKVPILTRIKTGLATRKADRLIRRAKEGGGEGHEKPDEIEFISDQEVADNIIDDIPPDESLKILRMKAQQANREREEKAKKGQK